MLLRRLSPPRLPRPRRSSLALLLMGVLVLPGTLLLPRGAFAATDTDGDCLADVQETALGTNPRNPDSDGPQIRLSLVSRIIEDEFVLLASTRPDGSFYRVVTDC